MLSQPAAMPSTEKAAGLTPHERDALDHLASGATDKDIAIQLSISVHTVKNHVRSILSKLHAVNRRQAARGQLSRDC